MDGSKAAIHLDGKQVARQGFAFRPRMVFIGDRPEGNFIACGRNQDEFFKGRMDHFRIYRNVHKDFNALGPVPYALTQMHEWSERDQQLHDAWEGRRKAKEAELKAGKYGQLQDAIKQIQQQKVDLHKVPNLAELETHVREANREQIEKLDARIAELQRESSVLRDNTLRNAHLLGRNPYPGSDAAKQYEERKQFVYHTTAGWDGNALGAEGSAPEKWHKWLKDVRGY